MTLINTHGMTLIGPGSEWFWAALQFIALAITFIAIYRQLLIARSQRAVEQVTLYTRQFDEERMARHQLAILIAIRDGVAIPRSSAVTVCNYFETLGALTRQKHLDIHLLWNLFGPPTQIWWAVLEQSVLRDRAIDGDAISEQWEWLVGAFRRMDRRAGATAKYDQARVALMVSTAVHSLEETIRVEQALRSVVIASPDGLEITRSSPAPPLPRSSASNRHDAADSDTPTPLPR